MPRKKGTVILVITGLILASLVSAVTYGRGNGQKIKPASHITVVDSNNKVVGRVQTTSFDGAAVSVGFNVDDVPQPIFLTITRDRLHGAQDNVVFESTDCTGTPYLFRGLIGTPPDRELSPQTAVVLPNSTLYVQDLNQNPTEIHAQSLLNRTQLCTTVDFGTFTALPATKMFDLDEEFTPPFTTR